MSPYPIPCALMRMVAISWTWLCLCEQAELSLPVLWHPCKLPFLQIPFVQPGAHLSIEGWQGRGWTLLTSFHLHNPPPPAALQPRIPGGNRWLCQLVAFRHPSHPPAPAWSAQWCLHQLRMTQGRGVGDRDRSPSLPALPTTLAAVPKWLCQDCLEGSAG